MVSSKDVKFFWLSYRLTSPGSCNNFTITVESRGKLQPLIRQDDNRLLDIKALILNPEERCDSV
jgi:hypothetical protein